MKPLITMADYRTLLAQVRRPFEKKLLDRLARKATLISEHQLPSKAIRLNSVVYLWHSLLRKVVRIRLVPPLLADLGLRNFSPFSPLGQAVMGYSENDRLRVNIGGLNKELMIVKVLNK